MSVPKCQAPQVEWQVEGVMLTNKVQCCSACISHSEGCPASIEWKTAHSWPLGCRGYDGRLKIGILPVSTFCSGHTFFVQRMADAMGLKPYVVHATFQFSGTPGKRHRMRESLLWDAVCALHHSALHQCTLHCIASLHTALHCIIAHCIMCHRTLHYIASLHTASCCILAHCITSCNCTLYHIA